MTWMHDLNSSIQLGTWLGYSALSGLVILAVGAIAAHCCVQPIHRIRVIQWTFIACVTVPIVQNFSLLPGFSVPINVNATDSSGRMQLVATNVPPGSADLTSAVADDGLESPLRGNTNLDLSDSVSGVDVGSDSTNVAAAVRPTNEPSHSEAIGGLFSWSTLSLYAQLSYLSFAAMLIAWWGLGHFLRHRLLRRCRPADKQVHNVLQSVSGDQWRRIQRRFRARLLVSDEVRSPLMWGLLRPTIVVPSSHAKQHDCRHLRWGLAHEWCHVVRCDYLTHQLVHLTKVVCFFQPLYWWLKRELMLSQDYLADAYAAQQGDTEDYAAFLVSLAKDPQVPAVQVGLGISDRRSSLFKRIHTLLQPARPLLHQCGRLPAVVIGVVAISVMAGVGSIQLTANTARGADEFNAADQQGDQQAAERPQREANKSKSERKPDVDPITYQGRVVDRQTGQPIAGAMVQVKRELSRDPKTGRWILLEMTEHKSDEKGRYRFTLPPEQVAESSLYLEVNAHHPNYQSKGWSGYSHSMIRTNLEKGDPPFYATIRLSPGEAVTGIITDPDGNPVPGVQLSGYTKGVPAKNGNKESFRLRGSFQYAETDQQGRFRVIVATPGDGVLWIHPKNYASQAYRIGDKRGEIGTFPLEEGIVLSGRVLDAKGNPVPDLGVNVRSRSDGDAADEFLRANAVANGIKAGATTDAEGNFRLKPLPPGTYSAEVVQVARDPTVRRENWFDRRPTETMEHVFARMEIELAADANPSPLTIQAVPHVIVRGRFFNGKGEPRASHAQHFVGRFNGSFFFVRSSQPGKDGWFEFRVPHGVTDAKIDTMTNEHSSLRWKLKDMQQPTFGRQIPLGTLESDVDGLEIIRYQAPIILVKAIDHQGNPIKDFRVTSQYKVPETAAVPGQRIRYRSGDVGFEGQADGRMRSSQLLPDAEITIGAQKDGFDSESQTVSLNESETRELTFVLRKVQPNSDESDGDEASATDNSGTDKTGTDKTGKGADSKP